MRKSTLSTLFILCAGLLSSIQLAAQTAQVQIIHNSPTTFVSSTVDIYVNGTLAADDLEFRSATPFTTVPADQPVEVSIAPASSTSADDAILDTMLTVEDGQTYIGMAYGVLDDDVRPLSIAVFEQGQTTAQSGSGLDVIVFHGAPDAPAFDVVDEADVLFDNVSYGNFSAGYVNLPADTAVSLQLTPANDNSDIVASYTTDLSDGEGMAGVVFASGFLFDVPALEAWIALPDGTTFPLPPTVTITEETALVQLIHNSPSQPTSTVDIYINGQLSVDDFAYRTATPFTEVPANTPLEVGIAPANSTSAADIIQDTVLTLEPDGVFIGVAYGLFGNTETPASLAVFEMGRTEAVGGEGSVDLLFFHGTPDAPGVDIVSGGSVVFDNTFYGNFSDDYISIPAGPLTIDVTPFDDNSTVVGTYEGEFAFWSGRTAVIFATGFLDGQPAFEPWVALSNGGTFPLTVPQPDESAFVQLIHNSPSQPNSTVDIYVNGQLAADDFAYRTATPFVEVPASVPVQVGVAPANSTSAQDVLLDTVLVLEPDVRYIGVAHGVFGSAQSPAEISVFDMGREEASAENNVDLLFFHGVPDAPGVDVISGNNIVFDDVFYGTFSDDYVSIPAGPLTISVTPFNNNNTVVGDYQTDFNFWQGNTAVIFATGFLNGTPEFEPWVALTNGGTFPLEGIDDGDGDGDGNGIPDFNLISVFPNPADTETTVRLNMEEEASVTIRIADLAGNILLEEDLGVLMPGFFETVLDLSNVPVGTHFLTVESIDTTQTVLIVILR